MDPNVERERRPEGRSDSKSEVLSVLHMNATNVLCIMVPVHIEVVKISWGAMSDFVNREQFSIFREISKLPVEKVPGRGPSVDTWPHTWLSLGTREEFVRPRGPGRHITPGILRKACPAGRQKHRLS